MAAGSASAEEAAAARAKILEGVDFIENEEDAEAVESAVVKIQSTFRGKKIRSKLGQKGGGAEEKSSNCSSKQSEKKEEKQQIASKSQPDNSNNSAQEIKKSDSKPQKSVEEEAELNKKVAKMQVNDRNNSKDDQDSSVAGVPVGEGNPSPAGPDVKVDQVEEAERAAAKIQAGFKGYKTRKQLESRLSGGLAGSGASARGP